MKKITWLLLFVCGVALANYDSKPLSVTKGGSGDASSTAYGIVTGGTTSTNPFQNAGTGTSGQLYFSNGASALGTWTTPTYANQTLSNLGTTSLNASLLAGSAGAENIGSATLQFGTGFFNTLELMGSSSGNLQIKAGSTTTSWTVTAPSAVCGNGQYWADNGAGVYSCTTPSSSGANTALSNLSAVAINTALLPASSGSANLGSAALPFGTDFAQDLELLGSSSGNLQIKAGSTTTSWTATFPSAVCSSGQYWTDNGSGVYSCTTLVAPNLVVVNGGDTSYSILTANRHVRSGTTLTAQRTYSLPVCNASNIGEQHEVKNLPSQTFNLILAPTGSDTIDGAANYTLSPGDSVPVICAVFASVGNWDVQ